MQVRTFLLECQAIDLMNKTVGVMRGFVVERDHVSDDLVSFIYFVQMRMWSVSLCAFSWVGVICKHLPLTKTSVGPF
jgi:hypothetical protein